MHDRRFWCEEFEGLSDRRLASDEAHHAVRTLRLKVGDSVELMNGRGMTGNGRILSVESNRGRDCEVVVQLNSLLQLEAPCPRLSLIVAECKGERLDWMVEKCTELGVRRIWLTEFSRSVVHAGAGKIERLGRIAKQACKQSGTNWLPEIRSGIALRDTLQQIRQWENAKCFVAHPAQVSRRAAFAMVESCAAVNEIVAIVGPEGGLTESEVALIKSSKAEEVRLGPSILRVETAALVLAGIAASLRLG